MSSKPSSIFTFEIVKGDFIPRSRNSLYGHFEKRITPTCFAFGDTGITLHFVGDKPTLFVPNGQKAELLIADQVDKHWEGILKGSFVEVRIF